MTKVITVTREYDSRGRPDVYHIRRRAVDAGMGAAVALAAAADFEVGFDQDGKIEAAEIRFFMDGGYAEGDSAAAACGLPGLRIARRSRIETGSQC